MTLLRVRSHNSNNTLLKDVKKQLIIIYSNDNKRSLVVFMILYICLFLFLFLIIISFFIVIELILNPIENEIKIQKIETEKMKQQNISNIPEISIDEINKKID